MPKTTKILILDNYDSFTYNLYQQCGTINPNFQIEVIRNDEISFEQIVANNCDKIIISPGAGSPQDQAYFGVCAKVITELGQTVPVLGICLGMQGICHYFGGTVTRADLPKHGKTDLITHTGTDVFQNVPNPTSVMRYHSLVCTNLPECLEVTATVIDRPDLIMGLRHKRYPIFGVQFHPESFATTDGEMMIRNFLE